MMNYPCPAQLCTGPAGALPESQLIKRRADHQSGTQPSLSLA